MVPSNGTGRLYLATFEQVRAMAKGRPVAWWRSASIYHPVVLFLISFDVDSTICHLSIFLQHWYLFLEDKALVGLAGSLGPESNLFRAILIRWCFLKKLG